MSFDKQAHRKPEILSPSRLADFETCPRKYQYSAVEKIKQPASYASAKGRFIHSILEYLFKEAPEDRTITKARSFIPTAATVVLTDEVRLEIGYDETVEAKLLRETDELLTNYFAMEDPSTVSLQPYEDSVGVEVRLKLTNEEETTVGAPLYGIVDRLDRDADGSLVIVDYKTGSLPRADYESAAFDNARLYVVLVEELLKETPSRIRLLYLAAGASLERSVAEVSPATRADDATRAWVEIKKHYENGNFQAKPSPKNCRWCPPAYKNRCRAEGVPVP